MHPDTTYTELLSIQVLEKLYRSHTNDTNDIPTEAIKALFEAYSLDEILRSIIVVLKSKKNPEQYIFQLYLFAKRALFLYAKNKALGNS